ncbi:tannase/feruloyl esterase family alpha/beta hydrolase [Nonomuraea sp. NPDC049480]|uniref:tannase/feruloyl esterase family alpha/beta hydrolase n=1 Tax=Nonomuraea sp. NPDC049480 TaxID=3364353 RepID=UPI0037AFCE20
MDPPLRALPRPAGYAHGTGRFDLAWDSLTALDDWTSRNNPPANPVATDANPAAKNRTRPLCVCRPRATLTPSMRVRRSRHAARAKGRLGGRTARPPGTRPGRPLTCTAYDQRNEPRGSCHEPGGCPVLAGDRAATRWPGGRKGSR